MRTKAFEKEAKLEAFGVVVRKGVVLERSLPGNGIGIGIGRRRRRGRLRRERLG